MAVDKSETTLQTSLLSVPRGVSAAGGIIAGHAKGEQVAAKRDRSANRLLAFDCAAHDWYRFVLSFPPHLVRDHLVRFDVQPGQRVLDPFCGTGTTLVECRKLGIACVGVEASPLAHFAAQVKTDWTPDAQGLVCWADMVAQYAQEQVKREPKDELLTLPPDAASLLLTDSVSPLPLHKTLVLLSAMQHHADSRYLHHARLALAKVLPTRIGNLRFGPEVGVGGIKADADVFSVWLEAVRAMAADLSALQEIAETESILYCADARQISQAVAPCSIDVVITSPPYPNEKDYTRATRLESVLLGFLSNKQELQTLKRGLLRSNTRNVYKGDADDVWIAAHPEILRLAESIEARRIAMGKTSGFERLYARVTLLYFGGMARHLADLRGVLKPGAQLAYVVGDQASYLRVMIRTGQHIAAIAQSLGYELVGIDLFRTRFSTTTKEEMREEIVVLRWPKTGERHG